MFCVVGTIVCAFTALFPEKRWSFQEGWKYRNPDAVEPSDASHTLTRIAAGLTAAALVVCAFGL